MSYGADGPLAWIADELADREAQGLRRRLLTRDGPQGPTIRFRDAQIPSAHSLQPTASPLLNFGSNDYLSLAADPRLIAAAHLAAEEEGWGAGASPLITGHSASHARLERRLAEFFGAEAALVFPSGFAANSGIIAALVGHEDLIFADQKNHASLIDGARLSRAEVQVYPHRDLTALAAMLAASGGARRRLIVTDTLFSMDGDLAPLGELVEPAERYEAMLMIDEAHAIGVFGEHGRGVAEHLGLESRIPIRIGTLSKALGCSGGFVVGSRMLIDWLLNRVRPYIFSTAHPPAVAAAAIAALEIVRDEPHRRRELLARAAALRDRLRAQGWNTGDTSSQIIPLFVGEPDAAMNLSAALRDRGLFVPGIRPPSVPAGESLLRISLCYGHTPEMLNRLAGSLQKMRRTTDHTDGHG
jgi:8-amino-7-oxononanoate synthase